MDLFEMDAASHTKVEEVRESIIETSKIVARPGRYKIFIIDEVHMLSNSSFNALLKTLEEPPSGVIFILATTEIHKIPDTIISRCQRFDFKKVRRDLLAARLFEVAQKEGKSVSMEVASRVASLSGGFVRDAFSLFGQVLSLPGDAISDADAELVLPRSDRGKVLAILRHIAKGEAKAALILVDELYFNAVDLGLVMDESIEILRKILLLGVGISDFDDLSESEMAGLKELSGMISRNAAIKITNIFIARRAEIGTIEIETLPLELAILSSCGEMTPTPNPQLIRKIEPLSKMETSATPVPRQIPVEQAVSEVPVAQSAVPASPTSLSSEALPRADRALSLSEVEEKWPMVLEALKDEHASTFLLLKHAKLKNPKGNRVILGFPFALHAQRVLLPANRAVVESALCDILGGKVFFDAVVEAGMVATENKDKPVVDTPIAVDELLSTFGGKMVG